MFFPLMAAKVWYRVLVVTLLLTGVSTAGTIEIPERRESDRERGERSPQLVVRSVASPWMRHLQHGGIVYFLYGFPSRVERFDLASSTWLPSIPVDAAPRGFGVSDDHLVVCQNTRVSRFSLDGSTELLLINAWTDAEDCVVAGDFLLTKRNWEIQSLRISTDEEVDVYASGGGYDTPHRLGLASHSGVIYGTQAGLSPSDILRIPVAGDGTFGSALQSPYHGDYAFGEVVFPSPSADIVIDAAGVAFRGTDLTYVAGTGGPVNDVAFGPSRHAVLRSQAVALLDADLREIGEMALPREAYAVAIGATGVHVFRQPGASDAVEFFPFSGFLPPVSSVAPDPETDPYLPDTVDLADDGTLYLFSRARNVVHRFSLPTWSYLASVPLPLEPLFASVNRADSQIFIAYAGGRLGRIDAGQPREQFHAFGPMSASGLGAADGFAFVADLTGAWASHRIYAPDGRETDWVDWNRISREYAWSRTNRRMYFFRDNTSPNDLHFEEIGAVGTVLSEGESPYHGLHSFDTPIRPSPNGAFVHLGSGDVFDAVSLVQVGSLGLPLRDATWVSGALFTLHATANPGRMRVIRWSQNGAIAAEGSLAGDYGRLFGYGTDLISVTRVDGRIRIQRWPATLGSGSNVSTRIEVPASTLESGEQFSFTVTVANHGLQNRSGLTLDVSISASLGTLAWVCDAPTGVVPCGTDQGLTLDFDLDVGGYLRATASGYWPESGPELVTLTASSAGSDPDLVPDDDSASAALAAETLLFGDGFELASTAERKHGSAPFAVRRPSAVENGIAPIVESVQSDL